jgi:hypothetical protein
VLAASALVLAPPNHDAAAIPRAELVAVRLQSVTTELGVAVVINTSSVAPPVPQRTRAAADATVSDITDAVSGAIHLGVSLFLFPALYLMSPIVLGVALTCILSLNCGPTTRVDRSRRRTTTGNPTGRPRER